VSLFIAGLAFDTGSLRTEAKIGTLTASIVAAASGAAIFTIVARSTPTDAGDEPDDAAADGGTMTCRASGGTTLAMARRRVRLGTAPITG